MYKMLQWLRLFFRRALILTLAICMAYFTAFLLFPYIDDHAPTLVAILATYLVMAYGIIPTTIRVFRIFDKPNHIPTCAMTSDGWQSDPVNVAILAPSEQAFICAMQKAGWYIADKKTFKNAMRIVASIILNQPYPSAPFSNLYLFGRKQDIGFEIPVGNSPGKRHHIRFWRVTRESLMANLTEHEHHAFWRKLLAKFWNNKNDLWVGACLYDSGAVAILWRNGQINHKNHPNADYERDFLLNSLKNADVINNQITSVKSGEPYRKRGQNLGLTIISDGHVKLCRIKSKG